MSENQEAQETQEEILANFQVDFLDLDANFDLKHVEM